MQARRGYRSDLSDTRWALIQPTLDAWRAGRGGLGIKQPTHSLREIVNAILYVSRTGIPWEYLPHDFPPYKTVYDYYARWEADGTTEKIHDLLRVQVRTTAGRAAEPTAGIIDAQAIKTADTVPEAEQGIDMGKKIKGRKRHVAVDTLGLLLAVIVTAASVQDTNGGTTVIDALAASHRRLIRVWVDSGYKTQFIDHAAKAGITADVVAKEPGQKGFVVHPRRWVVERTLGWLMRYRRLVRDYETNSRRSRTMIHWVMIDLMSRRVTGTSTPTWGHDSSEPLHT